MISTKSGGFRAFLIRIQLAVEYAYAAQLAVPEGESARGEKERQWKLDMFNDISEEIGERLRHYDHAKKTSGRRTA